MMMNPVFLTIGNLEIRHFSLIFVIGLIMAFALILGNLRKSDVKIDRDDFFDLFVIVLFYGIIAARFYYVLFNLDYYFGPQTPWHEVLAVWHGGLSLSGGLLFCVPAVWFICGYKGLEFGVVVDSVSPPALLVCSLSRIGGYINGDGNGLPTEQSWGVIFEYGIAAQKQPGVRLHPVMLYESALCFLVLVIVLLVRNNRLKSGFLGVFSLALYSLVRYAVGIYSMGELTLFGYKEQQLFAVAGISLSLILFFGLKLYQPRREKREQQFPSTRRWSIN